MQTTQLHHYAGSNAEIASAAMGTTLLAAAAFYGSAIVGRFSHVACRLSIIFLFC
jgi:hypothetical protein